MMPIVVRQRRHLLALALILLLLAACADLQPTATRIALQLTTAPATQVVEVTLPLPTLAATAVPSAAPPATLTALPSLTPRPSRTPRPTVTVSATATNDRLYLPLIDLDQTPTPTLLPTATPLPTSTPTPSRTPTATATPTPTPRPCTTPIAGPPELAPPYFGLHASADPSISDRERCTFQTLRPSIIKVLTFHPPADLVPLIGSQPNAHWIVRTFLEFGERPITPELFVDYTLLDTERTLRLLTGKPVVVELHNEPNIVAEGWTTAWQDGAEFADWWLPVLAQYRQALPDTRFIYPGLSPGPAIAGVRAEHWKFLEDSRAAVEAADGLGIHLYWSIQNPMSEALAILDEYVHRFPNMPIWVTEASYAQGGISDEERAQQYLLFARELARRPQVQGVTFFVASASNPRFEAETWVGSSLADILGERDR